MIFNLIKTLFGRPSTHNTAKGGSRRQRGQKARSSSGRGARRSAAVGPPLPKSRAQKGQGHGRVRGARQGREDRMLVAYHGTPAAINAADILKNGFLAGSGNAHGSGVYFSSARDEAKSYAGSKGVYLKCAIRPRRIAHWDSSMDQRFQAWCKKHNVRPDTNARTAFLLREGYDMLRTGTTVVVLRPLFVNPTAHKLKLRQVRILGVFSAANDKRVRV